MKFKQLFNLFVIICALSLSANSQSHKEENVRYKISSNNSKESDSHFIEALNKANMESYRLKHSDVEIQFSEGVSCIILAADKLSDQNINLNDYKENFQSGFTLPTFSINQDGHILANYKKKLK